MRWVVDPFGGLAEQVADDTGGKERGREGERTEARKQDCEGGRKYGVREGGREGGREGKDIPAALLDVVQGALDRGLDRNQALADQLGREGRRDGGRERR